MGFAEAVDCPVILVADIDRGRVFARIIRTPQLFSVSQRARVKGFVINRFRGDLALLKPGLDWLEREAGKPVLGVLPYLRGLERRRRIRCGTGPRTIAPRRPGRRSMPASAMAWPSSIRSRISAGAWMARWRPTARFAGAQSVPGWPKLVCTSAVRWASTTAPARGPVLRPAERDTRAPGRTRHRTRFGRGFPQCERDRAGAGPARLPAIRICRKRSRMFSAGGEGRARGGVGRGRARGPDPSRRLRDCRPDRGLSRLRQDGQAGADRRFHQHRRRRDRGADLSGHAAAWFIYGHASAEPGVSNRE